MTKAILAALVFAALCSAVTGAAVYGATRAKWADLGRNAGIMHGRADVQNALCAFAEDGAVPDGAQYTLDVKSERLAVFEDDAEGIRLYCD